MARAKRCRRRARRAHCSPIWRPPESRIGASGSAPCSGICRTIRADRCAGVLSRLRALVDEPDAPRIVATRDTVAFEPRGADVDLLVIRQRVANFPALSLAELQELAGTFRGEFLEGIDLPDLPDFQAWCLAEREDLRRLQARILSTLAGALVDRPEAALPHARELVKIDPFNEAARASLLQILLLLGRQTEAERHFESALRVFKELGRDAEFALQRTWRKLREKPGEMPDAVAAQPAPMAASTPAIVPPSTPVPMPMPAPAPRRDTTGLVGRSAEWSRLCGLLDAISASGQAVALVSGEPGLGKSRLLAELIAQAQQRGIATFAGHSFETDRSHPYAPWIEALGALPAPGAEANPVAAREQLFAAVAERVLEHPALLVLDDVQWCDEASADLLQHVVRAGRERPLLVVLAARGGELPDNAAVQAVLRSLRHAQRLQEIRLQALAAPEIAALVQAAVPEADAALIAAHSGGNPLHALEMARARATNAADMAGSLKQLVRDRIERLPVNAAEVLIWASILGPSFQLDHLTRIVPLRLEEVTGALEIAERHELLRTIAEPARCGYRFAHDLVHRAVYTALSEPRRRLMHLKTARALQDIGFDEAIVADIAHHAALGGEAGMAAAACVAAGHRCLRLFANTGAEALARKGLRYADTLPEPERSQRTLELIQVETLARRPADPKRAIARIEALAERALDQGSLEHARLGYHMLSYLRWEGGSWTDAQRDMLRAEFVSRSTDEKQRVHAMAEAARCLAMLERDLGQAEALALEARALAQRLDFEPNAISDAIGLLRLHQGAVEEAAALFGRARDIARQEGERSSEFLALEHLVWPRNPVPPLSGRRDLVRRAGGAVREAARRQRGTVRPRPAGDLPAGARRTGRSGRIRARRRGVARGKHRLGFALICAAEIDIERRRFDQAREKAAEALRLMTVLGRASEIAAAHALLARTAAADNDHCVLQQHTAAMRKSLARPTSCWAQTLAESMSDSDDEPPMRGRADGARRSTKVRP